jgi:preprotein translocase subunit SecD
MTTPGGDAIWVAPDTRLTSADIERAEARVLESGPAVALVLTDAGAKKMTALSAEQDSKPIALLLDGQVIWAPVMRGSIGKEAVLTGGPGGLTKAQIDRLLASFKQ